jgi:uncharacterized protein involved in type VI secretion and phage assembly
MLMPGAAPRRVKMYRKPPACACGAASGNPADCATGPFSGQVDVSHELELLQALAGSQPTSGHGGRLYGVYPALVTDNQDPMGLGRVKVRLPWTTDPDGDPYEIWARVAMPMAGANRGVWFIPEPDDEVLVAFEGGRHERPIVIGAFWNGVDATPETMRSDNPIRSITSRSGIKIILDDTNGAVKLTLQTPGGQTIVCNDAPASVEISDANGNRVKMEAAGITVDTPAKFTLNASTVEVSAGMVTVNAGMSRFSGVVQSDTNITNSTISASYTPGAGNIW